MAPTPQRDSRAHLRHRRLHPLRAGAGTATARTSPPTKRPSDSTRPRAVPDRTRTASTETAMASPARACRESLASPRHVHRGFYDGGQTIERELRWASKPEFGADDVARLPMAVLVSARPVGPGGRGVRPYRACGGHVDADVASGGKRTLGLLAGRLLVEGQHSQLRFDLDLEGSLLLGHAVTL